MRGRINDVIEHPRILIKYVRKSQRQPYGHCDQSPFEIATEITLLFEDLSLFSQIPLVKIGRRSLPESDLSTLVLDLSSVVIAVTLVPILLADATMWQ